VAAGYDRPGADARAERVEQAPRQSGRMMMSSLAASTSVGTLTAPIRLAQSWPVSAAICAANAAAGCVLVSAAAISSVTRSGCCW
jgi:hypothetical protein